MFTVDRIENDWVVLENRQTKKIINVKIEEFVDNIKENDIVDYDIENKVYIINQEVTNEIKSNIRNRFNRLKK